MIGKIFKAYDVRAIHPDPLNEEAAWKVGYATALFLKKQNNNQPGTVLVSRDMRPSSPKLCEAMSTGIRTAGLDVIDLGMCDTSFMYFAVNHLKAIGGVQTTASHNPIEYNGFKISGKLAKPIGAATGLLEIQKTAEGLDDADLLAEPTGKFETQDLWKPYRDHVLKFLVPLKRKIKVVIDASNGMAGRMIPAIFTGVENLEIIPINFEITGSFVHEPNPLVAENMIPTQEGVREHGAHLGACFDGDADRCMLTDDQGEIIGCDHLTALLANHFLALDESNPATHDPAVVYDLRSSKVLEETVRSLDAKPVKSKVGHVFMKAALREHNAVFGGELSGHFYFRDNYFADSGAIAFAAMLSMLGQKDTPLSERIKPYRKYPQSGEINFEVEDKDGVLATLKQDYADVAEVDELDGVTIDAWDTKGWWFNVRASNTEPLLRLNAEGKDAATLEKLMDELTPKVGQPAAGH
ncbi:phosphomannomutase/phosphoglucomutase [Phycisphaerales bacterium AB-hyl4]|uniref:Phosphomannomutase/phosphoglucomutase n=1 Tax=Natronomicrosphaera hydrolytica TaxID=3242702 RepID=A0ABV4U855_9BACT